MNDFYASLPPSEISKKINNAAKIQSNNSSRLHAELTKKIDSLSAIIIALTQILEIKGILKIEEINKIISSTGKLDGNNDKRFGFEDALILFGFDLDKIKDERRLAATKTAVKNRKLRQSESDNF
jgi:hypothetical protein